MPARNISRHVEFLSLIAKDSFSFSKSRLFPILVPKEGGEDATARLADYRKRNIIKTRFRNLQRSNFAHISVMHGAPTHRAHGATADDDYGACLSPPFPPFLVFRPPLQLHLELCELLWPSCSGNSCAERRERMSCGTCAQYCTL